MATTVDFVHAYTAVNNSGLVFRVFFRVDFEKTRKKTRKVRSFLYNSNIRNSKKEG